MSVLSNMILSGVTEDCLIPQKSRLSLLFGEILMQSGVVLD